MSKFNGCLLFDIPDKPIGNWEENIGTRGVFIEWHNKKDGRTLIIKEDDEATTDYFIELWWHDKNGDLWETIEWYREWDDAIADAKEWMARN